MTIFSLFIYFYFTNHKMHLSFDKLFCVCGFLITQFLVSLLIMNVYDLELASTVVLYLRESLLIEALSTQSTLKYQMTI